jgi:hypothetical protein
METKITESKKCELCSTPIGKGNVCTGCRVRKCRGSLVAGERCAVCPVSHPRMLRWHSFTDGQQVLCANHSALAGRRPLTFDQFSAEVLAATYSRSA